MVLFGEGKEAWLCCVVDDSAGDIINVTFLRAWAVVDVCKIVCEAQLKSGTVLPKIWRV